ncbi:MAG: hypothetical protein IJC25_01635, partial [Clostridia bacterium]|nr:hypothetical protein [Clostridia bacterium]
LCPPQIDRPIPLDSLPFEANMTLCRRDQMAHTERPWRDPRDLSAEIMAFVSDKNSLTLRVRVCDDHVCFSGGKFPFDNDGVMVFFDRREEAYRRVGDATDGVYGLLVRPGVSDEESTVCGITRSTKDVSGVGVSVKKTQLGYDVLLDVPFEAVGGVPASGSVIGFDVVINDRDSGVRRELQAVWSGTAENERIYLREAHHSPLRYGILEFR